MDRNDEVFFQDDDVCILYPQVKRGILVFSIFNVVDVPAVYEEGLVSAAEFISRKDPDFKNNAIYDNDDAIYFKAPFTYTDDNSLSLETYYQDNVVDKFATKGNNLFVIRIDPDKTYVYLPTIRTQVHNGKEQTSKPTRMTFNQYINIINQNNLVTQPVGDWYPEYDKSTGFKHYIPAVEYNKKYNTGSTSVQSLKYYTNVPPERKSVIVVHLPVIPTSIAVEII